MDDPLSNGHAFADDNLWRPSALLKDYDNGTIFSPIDLALPDLEDANDQDEAVFDLRIPDLTELDRSPAENAPLDEVPESLSTAKEDDEFLADVWDLESALNAEREAPKLRTWEAFEKKDVSNSGDMALLSEAGPAAFDAFITSLEPRGESGVLPQDYTLRTLCNLALGRASSLFQWSESKKLFEQTLPGVAISGSSKLCSESFIHELIEMGSAIVRLRAFATLPRALSDKCTAFLALQKCLSEVLDAVDECLSAKLAVVRSLVQLHCAVQQARRLVHILETLTKNLKHLKTDEAVISRVSDQLHLEIGAAPQLRPVLHALLARVSGPWLEQLASDLGFSTSASLLAGGKPSQGQLMNADFIGVEDKELLGETRIAVGVLRDQASAHPLLTQGQSGKDSPLSCFTGEERNSLQVREIADAYEVQMLRQLKGEYVPNIRPERQETDTQLQLDDQIWHEEALHTEYFAALEAMMSKDVTGTTFTTSDSMKEHVWSLCTSSSNITDSTLDFASYSSSFAPLERVRPLIKTQNRLVNGVLMRQLFRDYKLRDHLELQKSFHLFGNGTFVSRLSTALFSQDVQSAERRRGKLPTAETMGLRLGTTHEERWPPASSELQLTLMGILVDVYNGKQTNQRTLVQSEELPGSLSFSIRELPEGEIDRVLDPNSIYALDFLRLQYTAEAPLNSILTGDALQRYDDIFKHLLRLLRVVHVTADIGRKAAARRNETENENAAAFAHAAHHFISVLLSHVMDIGITAPWRILVEALRKLEQTLSEQDAAHEMGTKLNIGIEGLRQLHDTCLERIRSRLFLKRKQEKLHNAVEGTLATLLKCALTIHHDQSKEMPAFTAAYEDFRQCFSKLLASLREQAEKPPKAIAADDIEDAEMLRHLLARLNWNRFY